jgi:hypothetical protein
VPIAVAVGTAFGRRTRRGVGDERVGVQRDVSLICAGWLPQDGLFDVSETAVKLAEADEVGKIESSDYAANPAS